MSKVETQPALSLEDVWLYFATDSGPVKALRGVSYSVAPGEILAVVGESGSGKSVSARAVLGMLPAYSHREGVIRVGGEDITGWNKKQLRDLRGSQVAMVFQEPGAALDPLFTVGDQIVETLRSHQKISKKAARVRAVELLDMVKLADPTRMAQRYPHELSGGQKQRVAIAMAISCDPKVILADEPTTALDVTVQAEILQLLSELREKIGTAIVFISHNLGVVAHFADRVVVMRSGEIIEEGLVRDVFTEPQEEYTKILLAATPRLQREGTAGAERTAERHVPEDLDTDTSLLLPEEPELTQEEQEEVALEDSAAEPVEDALVGEVPAELEDDVSVISDEPAESVDGSLVGEVPAESEEASLVGEVPAVEDEVSVISEKPAGSVDGSLVSEDPAESEEASLVGEVGEVPAGSVDVSLVGEELAESVDVSLVGEVPAESVEDALVGEVPAEIVDDVSVISEKPAGSVEEASLVSEVPAEPVDVSLVGEDSEGEVAAVPAEVVLEEKAQSAAEGQVTLEDEPESKPVAEKEEGTEALIAVLLADAKSGKITWPVALGKIKELKGTGQQSTHSAEEELASHSEETQDGH